MRQFTTVGYFAIRKFYRIDGVQWAAAFAFSALFSIVPLVLVIIGIATICVDRQRSGVAVIRYMKEYIPMNKEVQEKVFRTINDIVESRTNAGIAAAFLLMWVASQSIVTLISAGNRATGACSHNIDLLMLKSVTLLGLLVVTIVVGLILPYLLAFNGGNWNLIGYFIHYASVFGFLCLFYRMLSDRRISIANVWFVSLISSAFIVLCEIQFVEYFGNLASINALYGILGMIIAVMMWIFATGCVLIFGSCLCSCRVELVPQLPQVRNSEISRMQFIYDLD